MYLIRFLCFSFSAISFAHLHLRQVLRIPLKDLSFALSVELTCHQQRTRWNADRTKSFTIQGMEGSQTAFGISAKQRCSLGFTLVSKTLEIMKVSLGDAELCALTVGTEDIMSITECAFSDMPYVWQAGGRALNR